MQYINHWPDMAELNIPKEVAQDLLRQLLEPFDSAGEAKAFWEETSSTIIILEPFHTKTTTQEFWGETADDLVILDSIDSIDDLEEQSLTWNQIGFTLTYPEYTVSLALDYQLLVAIVNDSGAGIYLVVPPSFHTSFPKHKQ